MTHPLIDTLPGPARTAVKGVWNRLSSDQRRELERWLPASSGITGVRDIFKFITDNYRSALDHSQATIAIVGPANVGKSTLYNQLIAPAEPRAPVSPVPGTTRVNQEGSAGLFNVVDTPGADAVGSVGEAERALAFNAAREADFLVVMFDAGSGVKKADKELFDALVDLGKPHLVVLNKMDLVRKGDQEKVLESAASNLGIERSQIVDVAAAKGDHVGAVVLAVAQVEPRLLISLADALPAYRSKLAWQRTIAAAVASASIALIPLPMADVVPLLGIQTGLVLTIARIYGFDITPGRAKELIAAFGIGFAARTLYRELGKLLGAPGWVLSAAVAQSQELTMPPEPRYAAVEFPPEVTLAPADDCYDFYPESWRVHDLSGIWKLARFEGATEDGEPGLGKGYQSSNVDTAKWEEIAVPWSLSVAYPDDRRMEHFRGAAWYRRDFQAPAEWQPLLKAGWRVLLREEGVGGGSDVWVNGNQCVKQAEGWAPIETDVTSALAAEANHLAIRVFNNKGGDRQQQRDGLWAPVRLVCVPPVYAQLIRVAPRINPTGVELRMEIINHGASRRVDLAAAIQPFVGPGQAPRSFSLGAKEVPQGASEFTFSVQTPDVELWWPNSPKLYYLSISGGGFDLGRIRFGYRTFTTKDGKFLLNGQPVKLTGFAFGGNQFLSASRNFSINGGNWMRRLLYGLKQANVDFIRPHSGACGAWPVPLYNVCDELGMMIYDEPFYMSAVSGGARRAVSETAVQREKAQYKEWVLAVHNHPSLVLWDFGGNERYRNDLELIPIFNQYYDMLKQLDIQGRPKSSSSGRAEAELIRRLPVVERMDFADAHGYPGYFFGSPEVFIDDFQKLRKTVYQKLGPMPVMNCEYGFPGDVVRYRPQQVALKKLLARQPWNLEDKRQWIDYVTSPTPESGGYYRDHANWLTCDTWVNNPRQTFEDAATFAQWFLEAFRRSGATINGGHTNNQWYDLLVTNRDGFAGATRYGLAKDPLAGKPEGFYKTAVFYAYRRAFGDSFICLNYCDHNVFAGSKWEAVAHVMNDGLNAEPGARAVVQLRGPTGKMLEQKQIWAGDLPTQAHAQVPVAFNFPSEPGEYRVELYLLGKGDRRLSDNQYRLRVVNDPGLMAPKAAVALYTPAGGDAAAASQATSAVLKKLGVTHTPIHSLDGVRQFKVLIIGKDALDKTLETAGEQIRDWAQAGGRLLCLEQSAIAAFPFIPEVAVARSQGREGTGKFDVGARMTELLVPSHPIFRGMTQDDFKDWNGRGGLLFTSALTPLNEGLLSAAPTMRSLGRTDIVRMVAAAYAVGDGEILLSQYDAVDRFGRDPMATRYLRNLIHYVTNEPRSSLSLPLASMNLKKEASVGKEGPAPKRASPSRQSPQRKRPTPTARDR